MTASQYEQALSVTAGDTSWDPKKLINNIHGVLSSCGGLIITDEEDGTIRPVHNSFRQFLIGEIPGASEFQISMEQAHEELAAILLTYMNYGVFETQLSRRVIPRIDTLHAPRRILHSALGFSQLQTTRRAALRLLRSPENPLPAEIERTLAETSAKIPHHGGFHLKAQLAEDHALLEYAQQYWLLHSKRTILLGTEAVNKLWARIFTKIGPSDVVAILTDLAAVDHGFVSISRDVRALGGSMEVLVAIFHSHLSLFSHEIKGPRGIRYLSGVVPTLRAIRHFQPTYVLDRHLLNRLLPISAVFDAHSDLIWLLRNGADLGSGDFCAITAACSAASPKSLQKLMATTHLGLEDFLRRRGRSLMRISLENNDARSICILAKAGALKTRTIADDLSVEAGMLGRLQRMTENDFQFARIAQIVLAAGLNITTVPIAELYDTLMNAGFQATKFPCLVFDQAVGAEMFAGLIRHACIDIDSRSGAERPLESWHRFFEGVLPQCNISRPLDAHGNPLVEWFLFRRHWSIARRCATLTKLSWPSLEFINSSCLLHQCVLQKDIDGLDCCLALGFNINATKRYSVPMRLSLHSKPHLQTLNDMAEQTPLHLAMASRTTYFFRILERGGDPNVLITGRCQQFVGSSRALTELVNYSIHPLWRVMNAIQENFGQNVEYSSILREGGWLHQAVSLVRFGASANETHFGRTPLVFCLDLMRQVLKKSLDKETRKQIYELEGSPAKFSLSNDATSLQEPPYVLHWLQSQEQETRPLDQLSKQAASFLWMLGALVHELIEGGADLNYGGYGATPFHMLLGLYADVLHECSRPDLKSLFSNIMYEFLRHGASTNNINCIPFPRRHWDRCLKDTTAVALIALNGYPSLYDLFTVSGRTKIWDHMCTTPLMHSLRLFLLSSHGVTSCGNFFSNAPRKILDDFVHLALGRSLLRPDEQRIEPNDSHMPDLHPYSGNISAASLQRANRGNYRGQFLAGEWRCELECMDGQQSQDKYRAQSPMFLAGEWRYELACSSPRLERDILAARECDYVFPCMPKREGQTDSLASTRPDCNLAHCVWWSFEWTVIPDEHIIP